MESSDDEAECVPDLVSNYYFLDDKEPISFAVLPVTWSTSETIQSKKKEIDMHAFADGGLRKVFMPVKAWNFDVSGNEPVISVLSSDGNWIKVQKPRKSYQETVRSVLITVNFLHVVKKNPEMNRKDVWSKLSKIFSLYDDRPSYKDLIHHKALIEEAVKHDESLRKSEYLVMFLEDKSHNKKDKADEDASTEVKKDFIADDEEEDEEEDGSGEEEDGDDDRAVCCICDNGGSLVCCDGVCMRSFHGTLKAAEEAESECVSLGLTEKELKDTPIFLCKNCQYKQHQCFSCGQLGSSDKSSGAEVFQCANATCGYFYHPHCVSKLLRRDSQVAAKELEEKILAGESFACPHHICFACKQPEDKTVSELQMAVCRRCPKAYHDKCLPRVIRFEDNDEEPARAWRGLLADRILIYCLKHKIDEDLGTPARNHIKFPGDERKEKRPYASVLTEINYPSKKKKLLTGQTQSGTAMQSKKKSTQVGDLDMKSDVKFFKPKGPDMSRKASTEKKPVLKKIGGSPATEEDKTSLGNQLYEIYAKTDSEKRSKPGKPVEDEPIETNKCAVNISEPQLDSDSERRILDLMKEASSNITMDDIIEKHDEAISSYAYKQKMDMKNITQGKVEVSCEALRAAIRKLDAGGSVEEAKNICGPKALNLLVKWKGKLKVYLAPFLYGMRYTSYGRHFTKIDKLKEIVEKIHCYVNSGDTVVDFCCGANDFSLLMKEKLDRMGKKCSYKNYDLFWPKNDFCFEKRDWMTVQPKELPSGSQLIMGLNPPFGVRAALANQFIDKALEFKPKLLILIVPQETERLDKKRTPYDLVWEDFEKLSGKSFYLPGSVDVNDKQMEDWNKVAPVLYLWSRPDWTAKHKAIAEEHGHLDVKGVKKQVHDQPSNAVMGGDGASPQGDLPEGPKGKAAGGKAEDLENPSIKTPKNSGPSRGSGKKRSREEKQTKPPMKTLPEYKRHQSSPSNPQHGDSHHFPERSIDERRSPHHVRPHHLPEPSTDGRRSHSPHHGRPHHLPDHSIDGSRRALEHYSSRHQRSPSDMEIEVPGYEPPTLTPTSYDATAGYGREHDRFQVGYDRYPTGHYTDTMDRYNTPELDPYAAIRRERYPIDAGPRPGEWGPSYIGESQSFGFNQPPQSGAEMRYRQPTYTMGSASSRMNNIPVSERYAPRLNEVNPRPMGGFGPSMTPDAGSGLYDYPGARERYGNDHMGFGLDPSVNYYPPRGGPARGWLGND